MRTSRTTNGSTIVPPLAIVAATSAICIGVAVTRAWPKAADASSASSTKSSQPYRRAVTAEADTGRACGAGPTRRPSQKPNRPAPAVRSLAELQPDVGEVDVARDLHRLGQVPQGGRDAGRSCSVMNPFTTNPVTSSPGCGKRRLGGDHAGVERGGGEHLHHRAGDVHPVQGAVDEREARVLLEASHGASAAAGSPLIAVASKVGLEVMARTSPVAGSRATTAPTARPAGRRRTPAADGRR